ncbi:MAG: DUF1566 domain-containing protein [Methylococcaceae bacterium]
MFQIKTAHIVIFALFVSPIIEAQNCNSNPYPSQPNFKKDNGNGTVTDYETSLTWKKCSEGLTGNDCSSGTEKTYNVYEALRQVKFVNDSGGFAGYRDWRLPDEDELQSLTYIACSNPKIDLSLFPNTVNERYWTDTPHGESGAMAIDFRMGASFGGNRVDHYSVRLVRGGKQ